VKQKEVINVRENSIVIIVLVFALILVGCGGQKSKQESFKSPAPQTQQTTNQNTGTLNYVSKNNTTTTQLSNVEYTATASTLVDRSLEIIEDFSNATASYNKGAISKSELDKSLQYNQDRMQLLIDLASDLDKQSQSVYFPGESIHLTTYLLNATREAKMSMEYLESNDWGNSKLMLSESKNDLLKFIQGYSSLK
jgi:hypothetical protein